MILKHLEALEMLQPFWEFILNKIGVHFKNQTKKNPLTLWAKGAYTVCSVCFFKILWRKLANAVFYYNP